MGPIESPAILAQTLILRFVGMFTSYNMGIVIAPVSYIIFIDIPSQEKIAFIAKTNVFTKFGFTINMSVIVLHFDLQQFIYYFIGTLFLIYL